MESPVSQVSRPGLGECRPPGSRLWPPNDKAEIRPAAQSTVQWDIGRPLSIGRQTLIGRRAPKGRRHVARERAPQARKPRGRRREISPSPESGGRIAAITFHGCRPRQISVYRSVPNHGSSPLLSERTAPILILAVCVGGVVVVSAELMSSTVTIICDKPR
jgi:hypothetical protein